MDIKLTDVQKKYGLSIEPSEINGYVWLRGRDGTNITLSNKKRDIEELAHAYIMGAMDWINSRYPEQVVEVAA